MPSEAQELLKDLRRPIEETLGPEWLLAYLGVTCEVCAQLGYLDAAVELSTEIIPTSVHVYGESAPETEVYRAKSLHWRLLIELDENRSPGPELVAESQQLFDEMARSNRSQTSDGVAARYWHFELLRSAGEDRQARELASSLLADIDSLRTIDASAARDELTTYLRPT